MKRPIITLLTDFGAADHYVAAMKGVILGICPAAELVDITHDITPYSLSEAAYTLAQAWQCFPTGTTHLAVVDPGVGSARRAIVAEVAGHRFVAPDNGLLSMVLADQPQAKIREITASRFFRHPVSNTFHGRDIFSPVAAHLAGGIDPKKMGNVIADTVVGRFAKPIQLRPGLWRGAVLKVDRFGNVITNLDWKTFQAIAAAPFSLKVGRRTISRFQTTYAAAPANKIFAVRGSSEFIEISLNQSDAGSLLGAQTGSSITLKMKVLEPKPTEIKIT